MLPLIAGVIDPEFGFTKRRINLLNMAINCSSQNVKWISNMGRLGIYSIMDGSIRLLIEKHDMNVKNVVKAWIERISKNEELVRVCEKVKEVVGMRDRYIGSMMPRSKCDDILTFYVLGRSGIMRYFILYFVHVLMQIKNFKQTNHIYLYH